MAQDYQKEIIGRFCEDHREILLALARFDDRAFSLMDQTLDQFIATQRGHDRPELISYLGTEFRVGGFTPKAAQDVVDMALDLAIMRRVYRHLDQKAPLIGEVAREALRADATDSSRLNSRLEVLLGHKAIEEIAGIEHVINETDQLVISTKIMVDDRPVYEDIDGLPRERDRVVLYSLRILYWHEGHERTFTVAMRETDLRDLASEVRRAEFKAEELKRVRSAQTKRMQAPFGDTHRESSSKPQQ
jgi:hypothetical protein